MGRLIRVAVALMSCFIAGGTLSASTFYISSGIGSDSNTSTQAQVSCHNNVPCTPWAHAPGMAGCSASCASYTPVAGDQFILRGGDTWNHSNLPWNFSWSGTSSNHIYLGVDTTWFTGGSFAKPLLNGGFACCTDSQQALLNLNAIGHITIDNFEITGLILMGPNGSSSSIAVSSSTTGDVFMTNLYVHNWNRCTGSGAPAAACTVAVTDNSWNSGGVQGNAYNGLTMAGVIIDHSEVGDPENGGNIGACAHNIEQFNYSYCHDASSGCKQGCRIVHDSQFNNVGATFDNAAHQDVIYADTFGAGTPAPSFQSYIYNNLVTNTCCFAAITSIYPNPYTSNATSSVEYWIYNNVVWGPNATGGDNIDPYNPSSLTLTAKVHDWNNTYGLPISSSACIVVTGGASRSGINMLDVQNLHCISPNIAIQVNVTVASNTSNNIVTMSAATATSQGYTTSNNYAPTAPFPANSTVGQGANLSGQCAGSLLALCSSTTLGNSITASARLPLWDAGAYYFGDGNLGPPNPPTSLVAVPE
jgi:hypothetical protein